MTEHMTYAFSDPASVKSAPQNKKTVMHKSAAQVGHNKASSTFPIDAIIPTCNRPDVLQRTLESLFQQSHLPEKIIVIDASNNANTQNMLSSFGETVIYVRAKNPGAAAQRNQGIEHVTESHVLFMDDDILLEAGCIERLYSTLDSNVAYGE